MTIEETMTELLEEIEVAELAAQEGELTLEQRRWLAEAKAEYRRLESRVLGGGVRGGRLEGV